MKDKKFAQPIPPTTPPVIGSGGNIQSGTIDGKEIEKLIISRTTVEAALTRWQEHRDKTEIDIIATNTVIAELKALLAPPTPEPAPAPPGDKP